jgi:hypothetical protein
MIRVIAVLASALLGASPAPSPTGAAAAADRVPELTGTWTCRTAYGFPGRLTASTDHDALVVVDEARYPTQTRARHERYRRDAAGGWRAESDDDYGFAGTGPAWTGASWRLDGVLRSRRTETSTTAHVLYERPDEATLRVTRWTSNPSALPDVQLCRRGAVPPDPSICIVADLPPIALSVADPVPPPYGTGGGTVHVVVSLDADSKVRSVVIRSSPSFELNASALDAARRTTYRTGLHDCRPVASDYLFTIEYMMR